MPLTTDGELKCGQCGTLLSKMEDGHVVRSCWRCGSQRLEPGPLMLRKQQDSDSTCADCGAQFPPPHHPGCPRSITRQVPHGLLYHLDSSMAMLGFKERWRHKVCGAITFYTSNGWCWPPLRSDQQIVRPDSSRPQVGEMVVCTSCMRSISTTTQMTIEPNP